MKKAASASRENYMDDKMYSKRRCKECPRLFSNVKIEKEKQRNVSLCSVNIDILDRFVFVSLMPTLNYCVPLLFPKVAGKEEDDSK